MTNMGYLTGKPIAVLGAGAVGKSIAADCALAGAKVRICDLPPYAEKALFGIEKRGIKFYGDQLNLYGFERSGIAGLELVTDSIAGAVRGAGIIIVALPCVGHKTFFRKLIPALEDGMVVHIFPDNYGSLILRKMMREAKCNKDIIIGGWTSSPFGTRVDVKGGIVLPAIKVDYRAINLRGAALPMSDQEKFIESSKCILVAIMSGSFSDALITQMPYIIYSLIIVSGVGVVFTKIFKPKFIIDHKLMNDIFNPGTTWSTIRVAGSIFAILVMLQIGPEYVISPDTGLFLVESLLVYWIGGILVAGFFMTFLPDFGLLEFTGAFMSKLFRPLFRLPGRAAVDCVASWVGDAVIGILITTEQYAKGYYSEREAATIATTFSAVSITFTVIVINQLDLNHMVFPFISTTAAVGVIAGIIMPRIPPLSLKKDNYYKGYNKVHYGQPENSSLFSLALGMAVSKADKSELSVVKWFSNSMITVLSNALVLIPAVMFIGTLSLIVATYTPVFDWLGTPFLPLLRLLQIPEAEVVASCVIVGFGDMFVPAIIAGAKIQSELTRFIIGVISITQLFYMSEVGALLLSSKLPIKLRDLVFIFILRTIISLIAVTLIARFVLGLV